MGEIIVKVPGDIKEVFTVIDEAIKKLIEIKKIRRTKSSPGFYLEKCGQIAQRF